MKYLEYNKCAEVEPSTIIKSVSDRNYKLGKSDFENHIYEETLQEISRLEEDLYFTESFLDLLK